MHYDREALHVHKVSDKCVVKRVLYNVDNMKCVMFVNLAYSDLLTFIVQC